MTWLNGDLKTVSDGFRVSLTHPFYTMMKEVEVDKTSKSQALFVVQTLSADFI